MTRYLALSDRATGPGNSGVRDVTHLIWPESAFPVFPRARAGCPRADRRAAAAEHGADRRRGARRSASTPHVGRAARLQFDLRDRPRRLDPVGLRQAASRAVRRIPAVPGFSRKPRSDGSSPRCAAAISPGIVRKPIAVPRAPPFLPLICYEIVFPGEAVPPGERPGWLVNLTNDGWFGQQHRALPAPPAGARARDRGRTAAGARRQHRDLGGDRSARPNRARAAARDRRRPRCAAAATASSPRSMCAFATVRRRSDACWLRSRFCSLRRRRINLVIHRKYRFCGCNIYRWTYYRSVP